MIILEKISSKAPKGTNKKLMENELRTLHRRLFLLQNVLYAENKHPILIILQGMDTAGKDGVIRHVFSCVNPMGCNVKPFKTPTEEELKHDFLWRIYKHLPEKGMIQIFNRSHYEDILMPTIHGTLPKETIEKRYGFINCFESQLKASGTIILKFFLHISSKEQAKRIRERKIDPHKKWKYDKTDDVAAKNWNAYQIAYEKIINNCSTEIPWNIIPSDKRWYRNYCVAKCLVNQLEALNLEYPS